MTLMSGIGNNETKLGSNPTAKDNQPRLGEIKHGFITDLELFSKKSVPYAHPEHEKELRKLEEECRAHIRCENQMDYYI